MSIRNHWYDDAARIMDRRHFEAHAVRPWYAAAWLWLIGGSP